MKSVTTSPGTKEGRLWLTSLGLSLLLNVALVAVFGLLTVNSQYFEMKSTAQPLPKPDSEYISIFPEVTKSDISTLPETLSPRFARTSEDQAQPTERSRRKPFIGERETEATSDRAPDPDQPPMPSQRGIEPRHQNDFETTESDYQDGKLNSSANPTKNSVAPPEPLSELPTPNRPAHDAEITAAKPPSQSSPIPSDTEEKVPLAKKEQLLEGPNPINVPVPEKQLAKVEKPVAITPELPRKVTRDQPELAAKPMIQPPKAPEFRGFQRKAAILGSISRTGKSALAVADTPLGRYQAIISRAVEQEWQRNCVRHRDFITPGFLTVRFFVETGGRIRTVQFVGEMETGEVQKGFTLNSIRDAEIPPMPASLRKEFEKEPLEIIFNFYF